MVEDRLMLCEDTATEYARLIALGVAQGVPAPSGSLPAESPVQLCLTEKEHHNIEYSDRNRKVVGSVAPVKKICATVIEGYRLGDVRADWWTADDAVGFEKRADL